MKPEVKVYQGLDGLWHIDNVEIISTGVEYPLSTGPTTFTEEDLSDAVAATQDPAIVSPRIKLGHASGYNEALVGDAEPAFGRVEDLRLGNNDQSIYGNYVGTPEWLTAVLGVAYPSRSIEGSFDVTTATGKTYKLVISAVSLLGIYWPGCQVLEDLPMWYGDTIPDGVEFDTATNAAISAGGGMPLLRRGKGNIEADIDTSYVRRQFYAEVAQGDRYWWWIRAERLGDNGTYLIAEDEEAGELYRIDVTVNGTDVSFGEPNPVTVDYPPKEAVAARAAVVAGMAIADPGVAVFASRAETGGPNKSTQEGASTMDEATRKYLAASLSLPEDATEEQINAKITASTAGNEGEQPKPDGGERPTPNPAQVQTGPATPVGDEDALKDGEQDNRSGVNDDPDAQAGSVKIDRAEYERLKAGADVALAADEDRRKKDIADLVETAIKAGKFTPARREHYVKLLASDFEGGKSLINELEAGTVPVKLRGTGGGGTEGTEAGADEALPLGWFPEIVDIRSRAASRQPVTQAKEG